MKIVVCGLSITSSWGNGHATTYRALLKALWKRGHEIVFIEKDVQWYRDNRDLARPEFCAVEMYTDWQPEEKRLLAVCGDADVVVVGSYFADGVAASRALFAGASGAVFFYDLDTPITLAALRARGETEYLRAELIAGYDAYLSFSGGPALGELEGRFGARRAVPLYCSVDPELYRPVGVSAQFGCDLSYLGTFAADRQPKLMRLLNDAAALVPEQRFVVAGPQYPEDTRWQGNVRRLTHLPPGEHPSFYSSSRFTLNLTRSDMVRAGYSPSVRLFEASACGAAIVSDAWAGLEDFLTPGEEILLPGDAGEVASLLTEMPDAERLRVGARARERILAEHTAAQRALEFEAIVSACGSGARAEHPTVLHG